MFHCGMRQMEERHVSNQIGIMVWSNRLDLLALSNFKGEVQVHRLHWQKVWNLSPPKEDNTVSAMAWRPDGKALAIGYNSGCVSIVDIEDKEILDKFYLEDPIYISANDKENGITCITWAVMSGNLQSSLAYNIYDDASIFLPKPPPLNSTFKSKKNDDDIVDFKEFKEQSQLSMLIIGYGRGCVHMSIFGRFPLGTINLAQLMDDDYGDYTVLDIILSDDFSVTQIVYLDVTSKSLEMVTLNTAVLSAYAEEMFIVANKHGQIVQMLSHVEQTMTSITEAWEHILLEMDAKMSAYAASVPEGGVSADFLELLMMGVPSDELELFLLHELSAKGLKKFGSSVELSYSTIQKLVLKQLNIVGQSLTYYLAELRGLTRIPDRYKILGLEENTVADAIKACCAFLNKCLELQQVIDLSMKNYKAFFRWLFVAILRLLDEQTPSEIVKITQQELTHIADFLYSFHNINSENTDGSPEKQVKFNLERLAQYLQDQELSILPDIEDNPWQKFLTDNPCLLKDSEVICSLSEFRKYSLVQQQNHLKETVHKVFDVSEKDIGRHFSVINSFKCYSDRSFSNVEHFRATQVFDPREQKFMMAFTHLPSGKEGLCFVSINVDSGQNTFRAAKYYFSSDLIQESTIENMALGNMIVLDVQFYSAEYLSVLLQHPELEDSTVFVQLPLNIALKNSEEYNMEMIKSSVFNEDTSSINITPSLEQGVLKVLDKMEGYQIAVSGGRKVAVVLSKSRRKVKVFEMEVDGDEDEDETIESMSQSHNTTEQSNNSRTDIDKSVETTNEDVTF